MSPGTEHRQLPANGNFLSAPGVCVLYLVPGQENLGGDQLWQPLLPQGEEVGEPGLHHRGEGGQAGGQVGLQGRGQGGGGGQAWGGDWLHTFKLDIFQSHKSQKDYRPQ